MIESLRQDNERDAAGINHEKTGTRDDDTGTGQRERESGTVPHSQRKSVV